MTTTELATTGMAGVGGEGLPAAFSLLLRLIDEAVLLVDADGSVVMANQTASTLLSPADPIEGTDVRLLLERPSGDALPSEAGSLPFPVDGAPCELVATRSACGSMPLRVRADRVRGRDVRYLVVARPTHLGTRDREDDARAIAELRRANRRLSGAFQIVLDTLDSTDVGTLFRRLNDEITQTMEADGTIVYLAESDGLHLRGASGGLDLARVPQFVEYGRSIERALFSDGRSIRMRVLPPTGDELRQGELTHRSVLAEESGQVIRVRTAILPPFTTFVAVPVWFGGSIVSIIEVGWKRQQPIAVEDARLLDSMAHYLSVQIVGAFSALRAQRTSALDQLGSELREELMSVPDDDEDGMVGRLDDVLTRAADELDAAYVRLRENEHQRVVMADLPLRGMHSLALDLDAAEEGCVVDGTAVVPVTPGTPVHEALRQLGEPCLGALLDMGRLAGERRLALFLRPDGSEPLAQPDLDFIGRLVEDVHDLGQGEEARRADKRISQALQQGMRNELREVEGVTAQGIYSSATATAFVGGDFYTMIDLPGRRACIVMGDVSGKGVEAASVSAAVRTAIGAYAWEGLSPARMVRLLNDFLLGFSRLETFATLFVGIADLPAGTLTYCSAGHPPAVLSRAATGELEMLDVQSGVVGAFEGLSYQDGLVHVEKGDVLLLYTDGTTEARDPRGNFFGESGLRDMVMAEVPRGFDGLLDRMLATLDSFTGRSLDDDVAMVAVRFDEVGGRPAIAPADE